MKKTILNVAKTLVIGLAFSAVAHAGTIVEDAVATQDLSTLVEAVKAAGLVDTLNGSGPFTVFAPTNEAFSKLPAGTLNDLLKPENKDKLTNILKYHVVSGQVLAADIKNGNVKTLEGKDIMLDKKADGVYVNNAKVVKADIKASNGVIHEIDAVLLPPAK